MPTTTIEEKVITDQKIPTDHVLVNDGTLSPQDTLPLHPSEPSESISVLRERYNVDGYLFLKGLLPRSTVQSCRESYFVHLAPTGVLQPSSQPVDGLYNTLSDPRDFPNVGAGKPPGDSKAGVFLRLAEKAHTEPWYLEFSRHPAVLDFVKKLTGWSDDEAFLLPRSLLRNNTPVNKAIGVHYDQIFLRRGDPTSVTAWVPIGDIGRHGGGLIYLHNGDSLGQEIEQAFTTKAKIDGLTQDEQMDPFNANMMSNGFLADGPREFSRQHDRRWLVAAYEAGDVVFHKPHMIHASTINRDPQNRIRLGTDLRFVNRSLPYDERWLQPFYFGDGL